jgi:hypothetical protein
MDRELVEHEDNGKIIILFDKWKYVINDHSVDGTRCRNLIQVKTMMTAYEQKNYDLMHQIAERASNTESQSYFTNLHEYLVQRFYPGLKYNLRNEWKNLNRENRLIVNKKPLKEIYNDFFVHMYEACRIMNCQMIKMGNVIKAIKDSCKEKYLCKYQKIARMFHDEDYEQANREARELICELNDRGIRNNPVFL